MNSIHCSIVRNSSESMWKVCTVDLPVGIWLWMNSELSNYSNDSMIYFIFNHFRNIFGSKKVRMWQGRSSSDNRINTQPVSDPIIHLFHNLFNFEAKSFTITIRLRWKSSRQMCIGREPWTSASSSQRSPKYCAIFIRYSVIFIGIR